MLEPPSVELWHIGMALDSKMFMGSNPILDGICFILLKVN